MPHIRTANDILYNYDNKKIFKEYCLRPAVKMRSIIQKQLEIIDSKEYRKPEKQMPKFTIREGC